MIKTGFNFIDKEIGGIQKDSVITLSGNFDLEKMFISVMQGILQNNDGYILLLDAKNSEYFTYTVFDKYSKDNDYVLLSERFVKDKVLMRNRLDLSKFNRSGLSNTCDVDFLYHNLSIWQDMSKYQSIHSKKLLAIVCLNPRINKNKIKEIVQVLNAPFLCIMNNPEDFIQNISSENDILVKVNGINGYLEPITVHITTSTKCFSFDVNNSSLKYSDRLKDCKNLWFYEENND